MSTALNAVMAVEKFTPETRDEVAAILDSNITAMSAEADALVVSSEDGQALATGKIKDLRDVERVLEDKRKDAVKPLNDQVKEINAFFKPFNQRLIAAGGALKNKILNYNRQLEEERRRQEAEIRRQQQEEEDRRRMAEQANVKLDADAEAAKDVELRAQQRAAKAAGPQKTVRSDLGTTTIKKVWTFKLEDISIVPPAFLSLNETMVRQAIRDGVREIPGLRIYQAESVSVR